MSASQFVGRVGGLAAALGVGAAVFAGAGAAWALPDSTGQDASRPAAGSSGAGTSADGGLRGHRITGGSASNRLGGMNSRPLAAAAVVAPSVAAVPNAAASPARGVAAAAASSGGASAATAKATGQTFTSNGLSVAPSVTIADGIIQGTLGATSERGATLKYSVVDSSAGAKLALSTGPDSPTAQDFTVLPYATWLDAGSQTPSGTQSVDVRVSEVTPFDQFVTSVPLIGSVAGPVIDLLQKLPLISTLLAPIIGASLVATVSVDVADLSAGKPVAFTYKVPSFDGTLISTNWFPSVSVANALVGAEQSPTIFNGPGIAAPGQTDPYAEWGIRNETLGVGTLRNAVLSGTDLGTGYNVVTWDPRGEFASGGVLQLDNPFFEGRDVSALVSWIEENPSTRFDDVGSSDPAVGMVGGSYGGGIQMNVAGTDPRVDGIVPDIAWNSMNDSIYPDSIGRTAYTALLALGLITSGARINPQIYEAVITGILFGWLSERSQAFIAGAGVTSMLNQLQAPTLLTQGTVDAIFPLQQSLANAQTIIENPYGVPTKVVWFCGGHGVCADFTADSSQGVAQATTLKNNALAWLDSHVNPATGKPSPLPATNIPNFQWVDQLGNLNNSGPGSAALLPYQAGFNDRPNITGTSPGGLLGILPFAIAGSGPGPGSLPYSTGNASQAATGIMIDVTVPQGTQVVGAPTVSFTYSGLGTARAVFAQVIDKSTGRVLGNQISPIPVTLDGQQRTASIPIADIAYTYGGATNPGQLAIQITGSATAFWNSAWGAVNISNISVTLPNRNPTT